MARERLKVGAIGTGMTATARHLPAWKNLAEHVERVGVAEAQENRANLLAETEGGPTPSPRRGARLPWTKQTFQSRNATPHATGEL